MSDLGKHLSAMGGTVKTGDAIEDVVNADRMNAMMAAIRSLARGDGLLRGMGVRLKTTPMGTIISTDGRGSGGAAAGGAWTGVPPLWLVAVSATNVKVTFGQVAGFVPSGVNTSFDLSSTDATWTFWVSVTLDTAGVPTAADISYGVGSVPSSDSTDAYFLIGEVDVADSEITDVRPSMAFDQAFVVCGRDVEDIETTPGTYYLFFGANTARRGGVGGPPPGP